MEQPMFRAEELATSAGVPIIVLVPEIGMVYKVDSTSMRKFIRMTQVGDRACDA
jgi:hypothetical protein